MSDSDAKGAIESAIERGIKFQRLWQDITMWLYVLSTIVTLTCSSLATLFGAKDEGQIAAVLAGTVTIAIGIEKSLLFREKWKLHLFIATQLENLALSIKTGRMPVDEAGKELAGIMNSYAESLPIAGRDQT